LPYPRKTTSTHSRTQHQVHLEQATFHPADKSCQTRRHRRNGLSAPWSSHQHPRWNKASAWEIGKHIWQPPCYQSGGSSSWLLSLALPAYTDTSDRLLPLHVYHGGQRFYQLQ